MCLDVCVCVFGRFCVVIKKENYPDQQPAKLVTGSAKQIYRQPGHTIYLLPTLVLANLLPCDLNYYVKGTSIKGTMKPGKEAVLHAADTSHNIELGKSDLHCVVKTNNYYKMFTLQQHMVFFSFLY